MLAASANAARAFCCRMTYREGFTWGGTTIVNPMRARLHPALQRTLLDAPE
jgi:hypothetical protein